MTIYLLRHGRQDSKLCNVNVSLSEEGRTQADLLGRRLAGRPLDPGAGETAGWKTYGIKRLYSSALLRAKETADIINGYLNVPLTVNDDLREIDFGDMTGLSQNIIDEKFPEFKPARNSLTADVAYPGGENARDVVTRVLPVMDDILSCGEDTVAVVTHGGVIRSLVCYYLGIDYKRVPLLGVHLENCSITELIYDDDRGFMMVNRYNDFAQLEKYPELLRSGIK